MIINSGEQFIIFSGESSLYTPDINRRNHEILIRTMLFNKIPYQQVEGYYNGVKEKAIVILAEHENFVSFICEKFQQECYMIVDNERKAWFVDMKTKIKRFGGYFVKVTEDQAKAEDGYTYDVRNGAYYIVNRQPNGGN